MKKMIISSKPGIHIPIYLTIYLTILTGLTLSTLTTALAQEDARDNKHKKEVSENSCLPIVDFDYPLAVKLPGNINSSQEEIRPSLSADGKALYFSRQHYPFNLSAVFSYEEIWCSTYDESTKMWKEPVNIGPPIKNFGPYSITFIKINSDTILIANEFRNNGEVQEGISMSTRENGDWSFLQPVGTVDMDSVKLLQPQISCEKDSPVMISSRKSDSYGKLDIYVILKDKNGIIRTINLGPVVNTREDESSPFLSYDNKTLYFASKGHAGYGGYDIFVSQRLDDTWQHWTIPENLGPSVNTDNDEEFYTFRADGQFAYFTRQTSNRNSDIYQIAIPSRQQLTKKQSIPENHY